MSADISNNTKKLFLRMFNAIDFFNVISRKKIVALRPSFCCQVAAWFPDMFCNFYLVKNHKIAHTLTTNKARKKVITDFESSEFYKFFGVCLT
jgi:hypothetical protein